MDKGFKGSRMSDKLAKISIHTILKGKNSNFGQVRTGGNMVFGPVRIWPRTEKSYGNLVHPNQILIVITH